MWTFACGLSVSPKSKNILELEERLYSSTVLPSFLKHQGLNVSLTQVHVKHDLLQDSCFEKKDLPYYNLLRLETCTLNGCIPSFTPICVLSTSKNTYLTNATFVDCIMKLDYIRDYEEFLGTTNVRKFLLQSDTLEETYKRVLQWIDIIEMNALFFLQRARKDDVMRIKETIKLLYDQVRTVKRQYNSVGQPFLPNTPIEVQEEMLPPTQEWKSNIAFCTVSYTFTDAEKTTTGTFELAYSIQPILRGHRLFYAVPTEYAKTLTLKILSNWPVVIEIDHLAYLPKQPWNVPILVDSDEQNLFDFYKNNNLVKSFQLSKKMKRYYDIFPTGTLEKKYNRLVCTESNGIITVEKLFLWNENVPEI